MAHNGSALALGGNVRNLNLSQSVRRLMPMPCVRPEW